MRYSEEFLDQLRKQADPVADAVVEQFVTDVGEGQSKALFELLVRNLHVPFDQLPGYVKTYMQENAVLPSWADPDKIRRAGEIYVDHGLACSVVLFFRSLPECYLIYPDAEVLYLTGRLSGRKWPETYARRVGETTQFVIDVMTRSGFQPGGVSIDVLLKVRLIHAAIRHFILLLPEWKLDWSVPINQEAMVYTLMTFSVSTVEGLQKMGIHLDGPDAEAYFHHWKVAGHVMGVDPACLPDSLEEGKVLMERVSSRHAKDTEAGRACTSALIKFSEDILRGQAFDSMPSNMVRHMIGEQQADMLGVKAQSGCLAKVLPHAMLKLIGLSERVEDRYPDLEPLSNLLGTAVLRGMRKHFHSYKGQGLRLPPEMENAWKI